MRDPHRRQIRDVLSMLPGNVVGFVIGRVILYEIVTLAGWPAPAAAEFAFAPDPLQLFFTALVTLELDVILTTPARPPPFEQPPP